MELPFPLQNHSYNTIFRMIYGVFLDRVQIALRHVPGGHGRFVANSGNLIARPRGRTADRTAVGRSKAGSRRVGRSLLIECVDGIQVHSLRGFGKLAALGAGRRAAEPKALVTIDPLAAPADFALPLLQVGNVFANANVQPREFVGAIRAMHRLRPHPG